MTKPTTRRQAREAARKKNRELKPLTKMATTAQQAAKIATAASVGTLILGHYSTRYDGLEPFKEEAEVHFKPVLLADDGRAFEF